MHSKTKHYPWNSKPSRLVNQDSTQNKVSWEIYTFVDSSLHKQRLITQREGLHSLHLKSMDLDGWKSFSKFPKLRTSKYPHQGEIGEEMSDLGGVVLLANPSKGAGLFREKGRDMFSPIFFKRKPLKNLGYKVLYIVPSNKWPKEPKSHSL